MLMKSIKYNDYDGNERNEELYFHLTKPEVVKWLCDTNGNYTLDKELEKMTKENNARDTINLLDKIIKLSYGKKSLDGKRFEKNESILQEFLESEAYSELFMELLTDSTKAAEFIKGILPKELSEEIEKIMNNEGINK